MMWKRPVGIKGTDGCHRWWKRGERIVHKLKAPFFTAIQIQ
jgi:hypothetical protein